MNNKYVDETKRTRNRTYKENNLALKRSRDRINSKGIGFKINSIDSYKELKKLDSVQDKVKVHDVDNNNLAKINYPYKDNQSKYLKQNDNNKFFNKRENKQPYWKKEREQRKIGGIFIATPAKNNRRASQFQLIGKSNSFGDHDEKVKIGQEKKNEKHISSGGIADLLENVLYIGKSIDKCRSNGHNAYSVTAYLYKTNLEPVKVNVYYCEYCKKFYIDYDLYFHYKEKYGAIMGNFELITDNVQGIKQINLKDRSVLYLCGYNVSQKDNLSDVARHDILAFCIGQKIINKEETIRYLQYFISRSKNMKKLTKAIRKWNSDLNWVLTLNLEKQIKVVMDRIESNRKAIIQG